MMPHPLLRHPVVQQAVQQIVGTFAGLAATEFGNMATSRIKVKCSRCRCITMLPRWQAEPRLLLEKRRIDSPWLMGILPYPRCGNLKCNHRLHIKVA